MADKADGLPLSPPYTRRGAYRKLAIAPPTVSGIWDHFIDEVAELRAGLSSWRRQWESLSHVAEARHLLKPWNALNDSERATLRAMRGLKLRNLREVPPDIRATIHGVTPGLREKPGVGWILRQDDEGKIFGNRDPAAGSKGVLVHIVDPMDEGKSPTAYQDKYLATYRQLQQLVDKEQTVVMIVGPPAVGAVAADRAYDDEADSGNEANYDEYTYERASPVVQDFFTAAAVAFPDQNLTVNADESEREYWMELIEGIVRDRDRAKVAGRVEYQPVVDILSGSSSPSRERTLIEIQQLPAARLFGARGTPARLFAQVAEAATASGKATDHPSGPD